MSIVIVSSGDKPASSVTIAVMSFVSDAIGVDGPIGGGVDDDGIEGRQTELGGVENERRLRGRMAGSEGRE
jgi:hypothetical protein